MLWESMVGPCFVAHYLVSSFAIISLGKHVNWFVLLLQCVIVAFPSHTQLLFHVICSVQF